LPVFTGSEDAQGGFVLLKITRVVNNETVDTAKRKAISDELREMVGQEELNAYLAGLKLKADVKVQQDQMEKKQ
jgi:peptidyl-prolyl cis-trans isomerase D